jgi:chromosomal replication initiation ATPase DnaA
MGETAPEARYDEVQAIGQVVRGDEAFARSVFESVGGMELVRRNLAVERLSRVVANELGQDLEWLRSPTRRREASLARAIVGHLGMIYGRIPYCRTAEFFRRDGSTLARDIRSFEDSLSRTKALRSSIARIVDQL